MDKQNSVYPCFEMVDAPIYYAVLYESVTKAINDIEHCNYGAALESLKHAQATSRSAYLGQKERG